VALIQIYEIIEVNEANIYHTYSCWSKASRTVWSLQTQLQEL